jgi:hypothetical protein
VCVEGSRSEPIYGVLALWSDRALAHTVWQAPVRLGRAPSSLSAPLTTLSSQVLAVLAATPFSRFQTLLFIDEGLELGQLCASRLMLGS